MPIRRDVTASCEAVTLYSLEAVASTGGCGADRAVEVPDRMMSRATEPDLESLTIRPATERDQTAIRMLVRGERLNPCGLHWPNFLVAADDDGLKGGVQKRQHPDGSRELGSLVVAAQMRGRGIAARLIDALLAKEHASVHMITSVAHAAHYRRWGFRPIEPRQAPRSVRFNYRIGRLACVISFLKQRERRQLVILESTGARYTIENCEPRNRGW